MTDITMIALSKLVPGQRNVRKTKPAMSVDELAASIAAHGLLQNLVVSEADKTMRRKPRWPRTSNESRCIRPMRSRHSPSLLKLDMVRKLSLAALASTARTLRAGCASRACRRG